MANWGWSKFEKNDLTSGFTAVNWGDFFRFFLGEKTLDVAIKKKFKNKASPSCVCI